MSTVFYPEDSSNFGVPGVDIQPTLSYFYDPYAGIDFRDITTCDHIQIMTLPTGTQIDEDEVCKDPFATNAPAYYGGNGQPGPCYNNGTVNVRHIGGAYGTANLGAQANFLGLTKWFQENPATEPFDYNYNNYPGYQDVTNAGVYNRNYYDYAIYGGKWGPHVWGFEYTDADGDFASPNMDVGPNMPAGTVYSFANKNVNPTGRGNEQLARLEWNEASNAYPSISSPYDSTTTPTGPGFDDGNWNMSEFRMYFRPEEDGEYLFCFFPDDHASVFMDNGEMTTDSSLNKMAYIQYADKSFTKTLNDTKNYKILIRHLEEGGAAHFQMAYQTPSSRAANGDQTCYDMRVKSPGGPWFTSHGGGENLEDIGCSMLYPSTVNNPQSQADFELTGGDGVYYRTDEPGSWQNYSEDDDTTDYILGINCNTPISQELSNFNRMRAVCKDGSYVEMANNGESTNTSLDPSSLIDIIGSTYSKQYNISVDFSGTPIDDKHFGNISFKDYMIEEADNIWKIEVTKIFFDADGTVGYLRFNDEEDANYFDFGSFSGYDSGYITLDNPPYFYDEEDEWDGSLPIDVTYTGDNDTNDTLPYEFWPYANQHYGPTYFTLIVTFAVYVSVPVGTDDYHHYIYYSGEEACSFAAKPNTELYYLSDSDGRPSLGVFATEDNNELKYNFPDNEIFSQDNIFSQISKPNLISNGKGRYIDVYEYLTDSFGDTSFKPHGGWGYIQFDGIGFNVASHVTSTGNAAGFGDIGTELLNPPANYVNSFIQSPNYLENDENELWANDTWGFAGYYPYPLFSSDNISNYGSRYAFWVRNEPRCLSYNQCLAFPMYSGDYNPVGYWGDVDSDFEGIMALSDGEPYRTVNQFQKINKDLINPYSTLTVSFWMKTLLTEGIQPQVEAAIISSPNSPEGIEGGAHTVLSVMNPVLESGQLLDHRVSGDNNEGWGVMEINTGDDSNVMMFKPVNTSWDNHNTHRWYNNGFFDGHPVDRSFNGYYIKIGSEVMRVVGTYYNNDSGYGYMSFQRGVDGTNQTTHSAGETVEIYEFPPSTGTEEVEEVEEVEVSESTPHVIFRTYGVRWWSQEPPLAGYEIYHHSPFVNNEQLPYRVQITNDRIVCDGYTNCYGHMEEFGSPYPGYNEGLALYYIDHGTWFGQYPSQGYGDTPEYATYHRQWMYSQRLLFGGGGRPNNDWDRGGTSAPMPTKYNKVQISSDESYSDNRTWNFTHENWGNYTGKAIIYRIDLQLNGQWANSQGSGITDVVIGGLEFPDMTSGGLGNQGFQNAWKTSRYPTDSDSHSREVGVLVDMVNGIISAEWTQVGVENDIMQIEVEIAGPAYEAANNGWDGYYILVGDRLGQHEWAKITNSSLVTHPGNPDDDGNDPFNSVNGRATRIEFDLERGVLGTNLEAFSFNDSGGSNYIPIEIWTGVPEELIDTEELAEEIIEEILSTDDAFHHVNWYNAPGYYNSQTVSALSNNSYGHGGMARFQNDVMFKWERKEFTFALGESNMKNNNELEDLYFTIQAGNNAAGVVLLDNFEVIESYEFTPDCDVRKKKGPNNYGEGVLTKYYDSILHPDEYEDTKAPLEAQFYFYPRYKLENPLAKGPTTSNIIYNDFEKGLFYIYDLDWGDGSPKEFTSEPMQLFENKTILHTYEKGGIFEVTGTMIRMKPDQYYSESGITSNKRFTVRIDVNEGDDEDFDYFSGNSFSFIPFKNTLPIVGGFSEQGIYYKSIKRNLGILDNDLKVDTQFSKVSDRLKTEIALNKMDYTYKENGDLPLLEEFEKRRGGDWNWDGSYLNYTHLGMKTETGTLGKSIGDADLTNIRWFNEPKQMWEMLGFDDEITGNPGDERYWNNIIPEDYSIFNREGISGGIINTSAEQYWIDDYYYPVLPKYGADGKFTNEYPSNTTPFPQQGPITNDDYIEDSLKVSLSNVPFDNNILSDNSGNGNKGFMFADYRPDFDSETLEPKKRKSMKSIKTSITKRGF